MTKFKFEVLTPNGFFIYGYDNAMTTYFYEEWERNSEAEMAAGDEPFVIVDGSVGYTTRSILLAKMEEIGIDKFPEEHVSNVAMDLPVGHPEQPITAYFTVQSIKNKR
jgi:hypothetical protein